MSATSVVIRDRGLAELFKRAREIRGSVRVGVLADSDRGRVVTDSGLTVAQVAVVNEFGTANVPERSFARRTFDIHRQEIQEFAEALALRVLFGEITAVDAANTLGREVATAMKQTIVGGAEVPPPNAPSTIARKKARGRWGLRTLVDSGRMVKAIGWAVVRDGVQSTVRYVSRGE